MKPQPKPIDIDEPDSDPGMHWYDAEILSDGEKREGAQKAKPKRPRSSKNHDTITEDSAALLFAQQWGGQMLYCHDHGKWFDWDGVSWKSERTGLAFDRARDIARDLAANEPPKIQAIVRKTSFTSGVERFARHDRVFVATSETWDPDTFKLGTPKGTVDLRTGLLSAPSHSDYITRLVSVGPAATADCPGWLAFLDQATKGDAGLIRFLQQWCGYSLTGDVREHALVFVHGDGGNGKGVFLNTVASILADYSATAAMDTFTASQSDRHPTDVAMLRGARLVSASETEEGRAWAEARIKQMTGGDPISARFMRQDFFTFQPAFKLMIIGNHKPVLRNVDNAARRRFNIVPFLHKPPQPDRTLEDRLKAEAPGILRWMIEGCLDWQENGLVRPGVVIAETDAYFNDQDLFSQWLDEVCDAEPVNHYKSETSAKLFESWSSFLQQAGEKPSSKKSFADMMQRKGFEPSRGTGGVRQFNGVRIKPTNDPRYRDE